ncbi:hypothetical protein [Methylobacterium nonmethylotrophicum]|uniref:Exostosin GT47 domain-containing protein n=1 Tax=Methylobacterium nonmethylotrophicum TaxID=1141884 RepID=A0A4Z0NKB2_9HYPH|nr:hypothetical protein [Methylobacterium nonmethylotrophicum]TGD96616.1 hypothetical protein EU555_22960 [Methylobacterium nonmethylotrophicum]
MSARDDRAKIFLLDEPDEFLRVFLAQAAVTRVARPDECDVAVYPRLVRDIRHNHRCDLGPYGGLRDGLRGRPLLVFSQNDYEGVIDCDGLRTLVYRTGLSRRWRLPNEFTLPFLWIVHPDGFSERVPGERPVIGFCGTLKNRRLRRRTLDYFAGRRDFTSNYLVRERFWAEGIPADQAKAEYEQNIDSSDFVICDRGIGNWTVRMYEVLSRGRIPVLLDTGAVLPGIRSGSFDDTIILARTRRQLAERILEVWRTDDLVARQRRCRALWLDNFSMAGFAGTLSAHLARLAADPDYREQVFATGPASRAKAAIRRAIYR